MPSSTFCNDTRSKHDYHKGCLQVTSLTPNHKIINKPCGKSMIRPPKALRGKELVQYVTHEGMRVMLVPSKEPNYYPITVKQDEIERLKAKATVVTEKDRLRISEEARQERARLEAESAARKKYLQSFDQKGGTAMGVRLTEMEREARDKANYLLKRAWELKKEDEDDVKAANSLILKTKCQAIRDAQLAERKLIQKEIKEEEKRLEKMMEDENTRAVELEKRKLELEQGRKERYVKELNEQVEEIQARRLLEAEKIVEERKRVNEAMYLVMLEELEKLKELEESKKETREALNKANEQIKRAQEIEREEARLADLKMQEYIRMKIEREEKLEREQQEERKRKELETARLRALQEAASDLQAIQDEMNAIRRQEEYEREWRRKEKEAALKRQKMEEECRIQREQQVRDIHKVQAMEIAREKREFEKILQVQMELQEKERLLELRKKHEAEVYREQILKQINEKEKERIEERQEKFAEGLALKAEEAKRQSEIRQILEKKIEQLKQHKIPEMYISEIQRQLKIN